MCIARASWCVHQAALQEAVQAEREALREMRERAALQEQQALALQREARSAHEHALHSPLYKTANGLFGVGGVVRSPQSTHSLAR